MVRLYVIVSQLDMKFLIIFIVKRSGCSRCQINGIIYRKYLENFVIPKKAYRCGNGREKLCEYT